MPYEVVTVYSVEHLDPHPSIGSPAVRLTQADGTTYDLIRTRYGWTCECRDWVSRRRNGEPCKHILAVTKAGVLDADRGDAWEGPDHDGNSDSDE